MAKNPRPIEIIKKSRVAKPRCVDGLSYHIGLKTGMDVIKAMDCAIYHSEAIEFLLENSHEFTYKQLGKMEAAMMFVHMTRLSDADRDKLKGHLSYLESKYKPAGEK